jgi:hypothetical protein
MTDRCIVRTSAPLVVTLAALSARDATGRDRFPGDVSDSLTLDEIGRSGYDRLCAQFESYLEDQYSGSHLVQAACLAFAIETSADAESCGDAVTACLDEPPPQVRVAIDGILGRAGCTASPIEPEGCRSTVGALKACLDALENEIESVTYSLTCAAFGQSDLGWDVIDVPPACEALRSAC